MKVLYPIFMAVSAVCVVTIVYERSGETSAHLAAFAITIYAIASVRWGQSNK